MIQQIEIFEMSRQTGLRRKPSGFKIYAPLAYAASPINGDAQICKHTSCGLSINENADPGGYYHFDFVSNRIILDRESYDFGRPKWHLLEATAASAIAKYFLLFERRFPNHPAKVRRIFRFYKKALFGVWGKEHFNEVVTD